MLNVYEGQGRDNIWNKMILTLILSFDLNRELSTNRGRNSVTMQRRLGEVTAPIKRSMFGWRSLFMSDTL